MAEGNGNVARKHIFCVNRSPAFLEFLRRLLQDEAYDVTTTNAVTRTFAQVAALGPDLVIVDLGRSDPAATQLLERLAADPATAALPVIVTATDPRRLAEIAAHPERYGADRSLVKPFDIDDLLTAIRALIGPA